MVDEMLAALGWTANQLIGEIPGNGLRLHGEQAAAVAVMAGCIPAYASVLRELALALLEPTFNLLGTAVTTGGASVLVVVSGPVVGRLGFEHDANALGASCRVNATVGRFAALLRHCCAIAAGNLRSFGTLGHPGRFSFCVAEHPTLAWPSFHSQFGNHAASAVTVFASEGPNSVNNHYAQGADAILATISDTIAHLGSTSFYYQSGGYIVVLSPEHLDLVTPRHSRDDARAWIFGRATRSTDELLRVGRLPQTPDPDKNVRLGAQRSPMSNSHQLFFLESGARGGKFSAVIPLWVGNRTVTRPILEDR
ncbi:MAG: hypothetical protein ACYCWW_12170 [Deltaproteobacteria bacterium]